MLSSFWRSYERHYATTLKFTTFLFLLQLFHLYWLTTHVVAIRLFGYGFFNAKFSVLVSFVDYIEIPVMISVMVIYLRDIGLGQATEKTWLNLLFLNSHWLHIFWITDEVVLNAFTGTTLVALPMWLSWMAIAIDYLEIPVMVDTIMKVFKLRSSRE